MICSKEWSQGIDPHRVDIYIDGDRITIPLGRANSCSIYRTGDYIEIYTYLGIKTMDKYKHNLKP